MSKIEVEQDKYGFHAVVIDAGNGVRHVTNTYASPFAAQQAAEDWLRKDKTMTKNGFDPERRDNAEDCPRYVCLAAGDSYVESAGDGELEWLIDTVVKDSRGCDESLVVWMDWKYVVAVVEPDGTVTRFQPPKPAPAKNDTDARLKRVFLNRRRNAGDAR